MKTSTLMALPNPETVFHPTGLDEQIRCRAYQLYDERGKTDGQELEDWFRAEAEIMTHQVKQKAS
jgi:hypothetical protein